MGYEEKISCMPDSDYAEISSAILGQVYSACVTNGLLETIQRLGWVRGVSDIPPQHSPQVRVLTKLWI